MFKLSMQFAAGITLLAASTVVIAQTPATPGQSGVGVTPQTAAEAQQSAVPRNDTGTVVRTGPTAADRTRDAASTVGNAASNAVDRTTVDRSNANANANANTDARDSSDGTMSSRQARAARADRN